LVSYHTRTISKVRIGKGIFITDEGKEIVAIESCQGTKLMYDFFYGPMINPIEEFKHNFQDKHCFIKNVKDKKNFNVEVMAKVSHLIL